MDFPTKQLHKGCFFCEENYLKSNFVLVKCKSMLAYYFAFRNMSGNDRC